MARKNAIKRLKYEQEAKTTGWLGDYIPGSFRYLVVYPSPNIFQDSWFTLEWSGSSEYGSHL